MSPALSALASLSALLAAHPAHEPALLPGRPAPKATARVESGPATRHAAAASTLVSEGLARPLAFELLSELCRVAPHRLSGSPGYERAARWAAATLEELGFENVRLEPCTVPRWERGPLERSSVVSPASADGTALPILALGGSVGTPSAGLEAELVRVTSFEELEQRAEEARGRIVLFDRPMDPAEPEPFRAYGRAVDQRSQGAIRAARAGAVGALVRSMTQRLDDVPHTGAMGYAADVPRIPAAAISTLGAERLARLLEAGPVRLRLELSCRTLDPAEGWNVVGELVGRELPEELVVLAGHLDAWDVGEGAHDDGAGCVQAVEAVRLVAAAGLRPRRTLRVVLYANEENGTRGAAAYSERHAETLCKHVFALESDRGGFSPRGFTVDASAEALARLRELAPLLASIGAERFEPGYGGVDIAPLKRAGVPLAGYWPDPSRYFDLHHSARDLLSEVHPRELQLGAVAMAILAYAVAEEVEALPRTPSDG